MVILTLLFLGLKYCGKLPQKTTMVFYVWHWKQTFLANVIKQFNIVVIYCHSMVITKVIYLYNTEWWSYHGMAVNYHGKKFYNIGPRCFYVRDSNNCLQFLKCAVPLKGCTFPSFYECLYLSCTTATTCIDCMIV